MAPTVLQPHPTPPLTGSCGGWGGDRPLSVGVYFLLIWWVSTLVDTLDTEKRSAHEKSPPEYGGLFRLSGSDPFPAGKGL
ncbi:hypothetical protein [Stenotrophomonas maltophilia]|uniref:hypothetical protein n=2 Tax=Stenotrophomonas TaxID=40323 RepID=UPI00128DEE9B|nr:hypothetical protein [Stenotrophomonas maltophilia]EKU9978126.1 hypothetical protein [Stenotrophomonas maltophilia]